jgi:glycosyltransferase involved in cell wall biosynthesis
MRVALVHDWLTGMRGGERVLERLCTMFPGAPIHTLLWNPGSVSRVIESHPIHVSFVQRLPRASRHYRWYLPFFPQAIESFDTGGFDAVISSSHCVARGIPVPPGMFHLSYVHTPMRYVWELEEQYFPPGRFPWPLSWYVRRTCARLRVWDRATSQRPDALIANSAHVADRIARHYGRTAEVIHPPVELARFGASAAPARQEAREFYLLAGAFAPYKRADLGIEACRTLGRRLLVVGSGQEEERLRRLARPGVEFLGWVTDAEMAELYRRARALIFPGEEDFGIVPVEAMASGCPVIAYGRGGALETVGRGADPSALERVRGGGVALVPGGALFGAQIVSSLAEAIRVLERQPFDPRALRVQAEPFAAERFDRDFMAAFERHLAAWRGRATARDADPGRADSVPAAVQDAAGNRER